MTTSASGHPRPQQYSGTVADLLALHSRLSLLAETGRSLRELDRVTAAESLDAEAWALHESTFALDLPCMFCRKPYLVVEIGAWYGMVPTNGVCGDCLARVDAAAGVTGQDVPGGVTIVTRS